MDIFEKSLSILKKHLEETSVEERSQIWAEIRKLDISGPSIAQYLESVQDELGLFNSSFSSAQVVCDDIQFADLYKSVISKVTMQDTLSIEQEIVISFSTHSTQRSCNEVSASKECVYAFAA